MRRGFVPFLSATITLGLGFGAPRAWAQTQEASPVATKSAASTGPLTVWLDSSAGIDKARLEAALEHDLGRDVTFVDDERSAAVKIRFDGAGHAGVQYRTPSGEDLTRQVDMPPDRERSVQVVSWLTVNLVRDEASELLDELRARRREEAEKAAAEKAAADQAALEKAAADKAAAEKAAADKAAAEKAAADKAAAERAAAEKARLPDLLRDPLRSFDAAVATPLSALRDSVQRELKLQLALGYGDSGAIQGLGLSLGMLRIRRDLVGIGFGVGAAMVGGKAHGVVVSAGYARTGETTGIVFGAGAAQTGTTMGIVVGGGAALTEDTRGLVFGAGGALGGKTTGIVIGGGFASSKSLEGIGIGGGAALVHGPSDGLLVGGGFTSSPKHRGVQVSSGVNVSRDLHGVAIAPINVQRRVRGVQIGVVNVADDVDGIAIGVLSFAKNGRFQPVLWTSTERSIHVASDVPVPDGP